MKFICATLLSLLVTGTQALASAGAGHGEGMGLLAIFFIVFGVLIILFQFIPGIALFWGMARGVFSPETGKSEQAGEPGRAKR